MSLPSLKIGDLEMKLPIIQGGMGVGVSLSKLAAAIANEGGMGIISGAQIGFKEPNFRTDNKAANINGLIKEIREARKLSPNGVIGINFLTATNNYAELVRTAVKEKVDVIISGAGLPKQLPELVKDSDTKIAPIVSSRKAAETIIKLWKRRHDRMPDFLVVEGPKAGGHLGFRKEDLVGNMPSLLEITKDIVEGVKALEEKYNVTIPVIAAGGIFTGKDIKDALEAGASGVQMATRFVATDECDAHENFKQAYVDAKEEDIAIISSPVGLPGRAIRNTFVEKLEAGELKVKACYRCLDECDPRTTPFCITEALIDSVNGDRENGLVFAGTNAYMIDSIKPVKAVIEEIQKEYDEA